MSYSTSSQSQNLNRFLILIILVSAAFFSLLYLLPYSTTPEGSQGLLIVIFTFILIGLSVILPKEGAGIDLSNPLSFYGLFYFLYYLLPYLSLFYYKKLPEENMFSIAVFFLSGYLAFALGVKASGVKNYEGIRAVKFYAGEAGALLTLCVVGMGLVAYGYAWKVANGVFFNQAQFYEQALDVASSFRDVFISSIQLPIILLLGLLSSAEKKSIAKISRFLFIAYSGGICLIFLLSSQTRPVITALIFAVAGMKFYSRIKIRFYHFVGLFLLGIAAIFLVQGLRMLQSDEFAAAENQLAYAAQNIIPSALSVFRDSGSVVSERASSRAGGGIDFFSLIIDQVRSGYDFLHGQDIISSAYSLIPRFLWHDKPAVVPPQLVIERLFGLPDTDAPVTPVIQFYAEAGWAGVVAGHYVFGWLMGKITRYAFYSANVGRLMILFFVWGGIVQVETELVVGIFSVIRGAVLVYLLYRAIVFIFSVRASHRAKNA